MHVNTAWLHKKVQDLQIELQIKESNHNEALNQKYRNEGKIHNIHCMPFGTFAIHSL